MTFTEWLQALHDKPGTLPPGQSDADIKKLEANGWIERHGEGWHITDEARRAASIPVK